MKALAAGPLRAWLLSQLLLATHAATGGEEPYDPDLHLNTPQIIRRHGYPAEAHTVQTADGYILTLHRIPHGAAHDAASPSASRHPVLLHHGLLGSSEAWILAGPERGLAYLLADAGYDVWLANARGNAYSRAHAYFPTDSSSPFWDFSFHEIGVYDLPAEIKHILRVSGRQRLSYIGHSMGTTAFFVLAAERPEAAAAVASASALAPVAFMRHIESPIRLLAPFASDAQYLARLLGEGELLTRSSFLKYLAKYGCELLEEDKTICENLVFVICGYDAAQFDQKLLPLMLSHSPRGASTKTAIHYAQLINSGNFQRFDYGRNGNLKKYNSTVPPMYDISKISVPMHLYYANNDWLAAPLDVNHFYQSLACEKTKYLVPFPSFNHIDFIVAKDVKKLLYDSVIHQLPQYEYDDGISNSID